jgi:hypothetical protein
MTEQISTLNTLAESFKSVLLESDTIIDIEDPGSGRELLANGLINLNADNISELVAEEMRLDYDLRDFISAAATEGLTEDQMLEVIQNYDISAETILSELINDEELKDYVGDNLTDDFISTDEDFLTKYLEDRFGERFVDTENSSVTERWIKEMLPDICVENELIDTSSEEEIRMGLRNMIVDEKVCDAIASLIWACKQD